MTTPLEPYSTVKDSGIDWLGSVPSHWEMLPGRTCLLVKRESNTGLKETTVLSLSYGKIVVKPPEKLHGLVPASFETYQIVDPGDVVVRPTDLQNDKHSLRFGISRNRGIITSAYLCFVPTDRLKPEYCHLLLHSYDLMKVFYGLGSGLRQNLDWVDFKYLPCVVPPPPEQTAIARFLDHMDRRIQKYIHAKEKLIALLDEYKQALIHQVVTNGLTSNPTVVSTSSSWFPKIPTGWKVLPLRRVIHSAIDGPHHSPNYVDQGIPFLSAMNIKVDCWSLNDVKHISKEDYDKFSRRVTPNPGDVLYTKVGTTGVARVVDLDYPFQIWVSVAVLKLKKNLVCPRYLAIALNSTRCYEQSQLVTRGATNQNLLLSQMKHIELPIPPLTVQHQLVEYVNSVENQVISAVEATSQQIDLLRDFRIRLIADVVTGKLDVRKAATVLPDTNAMAREDGLDTIQTESHSHRTEHGISERANA